MNKAHIKFNRKDQPDFLKELRTRVNDYFDSNNVSIHANTNMKIKTAFMLLLYFTPLVAMLTGSVTGFWPTMVMWALMGLGMSGIGTSVMHDALHGAYSKNKKVNQVLGFMIQFIGGTRINWKIQHNVLHHAYTNIAEYDEDIDVGVMRFSPNQEWKWYYRFQAYYAVVLYSLMTLHWALTKDFIQLTRYERKNLLSKHGVKFKSELAKLITHKAWYFALIIVLPLIFIDLPWWQVILGFVTMQVICGLTLALIFQAAHVLSETEFFEVDEESEGNVENSWAIHQMKTTANFAPRNGVLSWLIGGLNYQIEHHLFPHICHVHYRKLSVIVQETAAKYGVPYYQHRTFYGAIRSHFSHLNQLGSPSAA